MDKRDWRKRVGLLIYAALSWGCASGESEGRASAADVVSRSQVEFQPLNPARGNAGPQAGVLWGDIRADVPSGAVIVFADGFSSPPHIHNVTYRGVVISGRVHNDDPDAAIMWMESGSFWTQPAGESHITATAPGEEATVLLEILEGPYLVDPPEQSFDNGERPVNLESRNIVWLSAADVGWLSATASKGTKIAFLWGDPAKKNGSFLKLPPDFSGELQGSGAWLRAVTISGETSYREPGTAGGSDKLEPGSYFGSSGEQSHRISCGSGTACIIYVSTTGKYKLL